MLAGNRASELDRGLKNFCKCLLDTMHLFMVTRVSCCSWMQIAITCMSESCNIHIVFLGNSICTQYHFRNFRARYSSILKDRRRAKACECGKGASSSCQQLFCFVTIRCNINSIRLLFLTYKLYFFNITFNHFRFAILLNNKDCGHIQRQTDFREIINNSNGWIVQYL
ncbi:hypothetical protein D3C78_1450640 [compost metagenome]